MKNIGAGIPHADQGKTNVPAIASTSLQPKPNLQTPSWRASDTQGMLFKALDGTWVFPNIWKWRSEWVAPLQAMSACK